MSGCIENPCQILLLNTILITSFVNLTSVIRIIHDSLEAFNILGEFFDIDIWCCFLYEKAGNMYKLRNEIFLHVKCTAHLMFNENICKF